MTTKKGPKNELYITTYYHTKYVEVLGCISQLICDLHQKKSGKFLPQRIKNWQFFQFLGQFFFQIWSLGVGWLSFLLQVPSFFDSRLFDPKKSTDSFIPTNFWTQKNLGIWKSNLGDRSLSFFTESRLLTPKNPPTPNSQLRLPSPVSLLY